MKKVLSVILISVICTCLVSCSNSNNIETTTEATTMAQTEEIQSSGDVIIPTKAFVEITNIITNIGIKTSTQQVTSLLVEDIKSQDEETKDYLVTYNFKNGYEELINQNVSFTYSENGIVKSLSITFSHCPEDKEKMIKAIESVLTTKDLNIPESESNEVLEAIQSHSAEDHYSKEFNARSYAFDELDNGDFLNFIISFNY